MKRPSKKEIKAAVEKLQQKPENQSSGTAGNEKSWGKLQPKQSSQRIRKKGV